MQSLVTPQCAASCVCGVHRKLSTEEAVEEEARGGGMDEMPGPSAVSLAAGPKGGGGHDEGRPPGSAIQSPGRASCLLLLLLLLLDDARRSELGPRSRPPSAGRGSGAGACNGDAWRGRGPPPGFGLLAPPPCISPTVCSALGACDACVTPAHMAAAKPIGSPQQENEKRRRATG